LGAAYLAGMHIGFYPQPGEFARSWSLERRFESKMDNDKRERSYEGWQDAVRRTLK
jgi:glycerol kinase